MSLRVLTVDTSGAMQAFAAARRAPLYADRALGTAAEEIRQDWMRLVPKANGDLWKNIKRARLAPLIHQIISRARHGRWVEEGTGLYGPKARRPGRGMLPDSGVTAIAKWIARKGIVARKVSQEELPWIIARKIARDGTPAQPSAELALNVNRPRVNQLVAAAIARAISETGLTRVT